MIAALMLYCFAVSTLLAGAAVAVEHLLRLARRPSRFVWLVAMLAGVGFSVARFQSALTASPPASMPIAPASSETAVDDTTLGATTPSTPVATVPSSIVRAGRTVFARMNAMRILVTTGSTVTRLDEPLVVAWLAFSAIGLIVIGYSAFRLARPEPRWATATVDGVPVLLSHDLGPAVIGLFRYRIVLPAWALELAPVERDLVLVHEREHAIAGDPSLLFVATVLVALSPWNAALWWMARRLRFAIELDCDARVLHHRPDRTAYGALLLDVNERTFGGAVPIVALAEPVSLIERRISAITSRGPRFAVVRALMAGSAAAVLVAIACAAPRPASISSPSRAAGRASSLVALAPVPASATTADAHSGTPRQDLVTLPKKAAAVVARPAPRDTGVAARVDTAAPPPTPARTPNVGPDVEAFFHRLFDGIALTPDQEALARDILTKLEDQQAAQTAIVMQAAATVLPKRAAVQAQRDSALRALLATDADRVAFDARLAPLGRGGRSGGPGPDSLGRGGRGAGRGGGGGVSIPEFVDANFHRLFDGITLTLAQEASARATLAKAQQDLQTMTLPLLPVQLAMGPGMGLVVMQGQSDSALVAVVTNDADRATLQSRIRIALPPPTLPQP